MEVYNKSWCQPRELLVEILQEYPEEVEHIFIPSCVVLTRCAGYCNDEMLQCMPTATYNITMEVSSVIYNSNTLGVLCSGVHRGGNDGGPCFFSFFSKLTYFWSLYLTRIWILPKCHTIGAHGLLKCPKVPFWSIQVPQLFAQRLLRYDIWAKINLTLASFLIFMYEESFSLQLSVFLSVISSKGWRSLSTLHLLIVVYLPF